MTELDRYLMGIGFTVTLMLADVFAAWVTG